MIDHIIAIDGRVHFREAFKRFNDRFDIEGHKAQTDAVTFFEGVAVLLTQIHDRLHVHFVERGQHRGGVFRFQQTLGHAFAQAGHRHAFFAAGAKLRLRCSGLFRGFCRVAAVRFRQMFFHIFTGQTAADAGAFDGGRVQVVFGEQTADSRAQRVVILFFQRRLLALRRGRFFRFRFGAALFARAVAFAQTAQDLARRHGAAFVFQYRIQHAVSRRRYFQYHFVSFDFYQHFITFHRVARLFVPGGDGCVSNGFRQVGNKNIYATHYLSFN
ncbi:hypothetical protein BN132_3591 [Cronobacter turicensis 564]|nr:hypothetical protein BN132_3591 [Cronobacter turicensis 564]